MKLTKFSALAFASMMALASCSKEEAKNPGMPDLLPGEARIVLNLGGNGATTYSTTLAENSVKSANAKLFDVNSGDSIALTNRTFDAATKTFSATVAPEAVTAKKNVVMYLYVNGIAVEATGGTAQVNHENATVTTVIDRELTNGAPAGLKSMPFELKEGQNLVKGEAGNEKAKRAIARVAVANASKGTANPMAIDGFKITFDQLNLTTGGKMYGGRSNESTNTVVGETTNFSYTVAADGLTDVAGATGKVETVAYMYPSSTVTATITALDGKTRTVSFLPSANKNYLIKITPTKTGSSVDFGVSIDETWQGNDELGADFGSKLAANPSYNSDGITVEGKTLKLAFKDNGNSTISNLGDLFPAYKAEIDNGTVEVKFESFAKALAQVAFTYPNANQVNIAGPIVYNTNGFDCILDVKAVKKGTSEVIESSRFTMHFAGLGLPEGFIVDMGGGKEFMALATQASGNINDDIAKFNDVMKLAGATFNEKLENAIKAGAATNPNLAGKNIASTLKGYCPVGFGVPSIEDYKVLFNGISHNDAKWIYRLTGTAEQLKFGVMHPLVDKDGKEMSTERTVGRFLATAPTISSYSKVAYNNNVLFFFTPGYDATIYGGYHTKEGSYNIVAASRDESYALLGAAEGNKNTAKLRCIKQNNDRIIW